MVHASPSCHYIMTDSRSSADSGSIDRSGEGREALLGQLRYLTDELEALENVIHLVPEGLRASRPTPDELTIKEIFGVIATLDEEVRRPRLERMTQADEPPSFSESDDADEIASARDWNGHALDDILERVQSGRRKLIDTFEALDAAQWDASATFGKEERDVYELALHIIREDSERLRTISYRLHDSTLTDREGGLPT